MVEIRRTVGLRLIFFSRRIDFLGYAEEIKACPRRAMRRAFQVYLISPDKNILIQDIFRNLGE
jgi:hypothetical protein